MDKEGQHTGQKDRQSVHKGYFFCYLCTIHHKTLNYNYMKMLTSSASAYEAPQAELLLVRIEQNFLVSQTSQGKGQNITFETESDFDEFFGS